MNDKSAAAGPAPATPGSGRCRVCPRHDGVPCAYIDGKGQACSTTWCPDHVGMVEGKPYCRRHSGTVAVLAAMGEGGHLPDIDNRAHSLVVWVGNDLDESMRLVLGKVRRPATETLLVEPVVYLFTVYRTHLWERSWKLVDDTGVVLKISVDVDEANDSEVRLRIGKRTIMSMVPPWIERRFAGPRFTSDIQSRREFYSTLLSAAEEAIGAAR